MTFLLQVKSSVVLENKCCLPLPVKFVTCASKLGGKIMWQNYLIVICKTVV